MADLNIQLTRGNDATVNFHFTDPQDSGNPLDMSDAIGMVLIFIDSNNKVFAKFSMNQTGSLTDYEPIDITDAANGNITVEIQAEQTLLARPGQVSYMFKVTYEKLPNSNEDADYGFSKPLVFGVMNDSPTAAVVTH